MRDAGNEEVEEREHVKMYKISGVQVKKVLRYISQKVKIVGKIHFICFIPKNDKGYDRCSLG